MNPVVLMLLSLWLGAAIFGITVWQSVLNQRAQPTGEPLVLAVPPPGQHRRARVRPPRRVPEEWFAAALREPAQPLSTVRPSPRWEDDERTTGLVFTYDPAEARHV